MKKLRMIVTSVVVLAIVGSALAFNAKKTQFCVVVKGGGDPVDCTTYTTGATLKRVISGGTIYKYVPNWDGDGAACTTANNGLCTSTSRIDLD